MARVTWEPPGPDGICIDIWGRESSNFVKIYVGLEENNTACTSISEIKFLFLPPGTGENSYPSLSWSGPHPWNDIGVFLVTVL